MKTLDELYKELGTIQYNLELYKALLEDLEEKKHHLLGLIQKATQSSGQESEENS